jgi:formate-dependent phosphoribosylglycinamide formyltransferase (GAR transformylase)
MQVGAVRLASKSRTLKGRRIGAALARANAVEPATWLAVDAEPFENDHEAWR